jgi:hypothetical protein
VVDTIQVHPSWVADTDNLVQGLKKFWLLRGVFEKMNKTNAVPGKAQPAAR